MGAEVRGDGQEVRGAAEGAARSGGVYQQRLRDVLYMGVACRHMPVSAFLPTILRAHLGHIHLLFALQTA